MDSEQRKFLARSIYGFRDVDPSKFTNRRIQITQVALSASALSFRDTRTAPNQRRPQGVFVHVLLPAQAMAQPANHCHNIAVIMPRSAGDGSSHVVRPETVVVRMPQTVIARREYDKEIFNL